MSNQGTLYVIATPIGNLSDITLRALDTIKKVKILLAEDTRITKKLLTHYGIQAELESLHDFNESEKISVVIEQLLRGVDIGIVSDAGTPLISDPGYKLVTAAQYENIPVRPIPGANAVITALSVAGIATDRFTFEGFLPKKAAERIAYLQMLKYERRSMVFYESPQRIQQTLQSFIEVFGGQRTATFLRELTKQFEQHLHGDLSSIKQTLQEHPEKIKGEFVLVVSGNDSSNDAESIEQAQQLLADLQAHMSHKDAVEIVAKHTNIGRNQLYSLGLNNALKHTK